MFATLDGEDKVVKLRVAALATPTAKSSKNIVNKPKKILFDVILCCNFVITMVYKCFASPKYKL